MSRFRQRYKSNLKVKSTWKSSTGLTFTYNTDADVVKETMLDGTVIKPKERRPTLSDSVRTRRKSRQFLSYSKWPFHHLQYTSSGSSEEITSWTMADTTGGNRKWTASGGQTQSILQFFGLSYPSVWPTPQSPLGFCVNKAINQSFIYLDRPKLTLGEPIAELRTLPRDLAPHLASLDEQTRKYRKALDRLLGKGLKRYKVASKIFSDLWSHHAFFIAPAVRTMEDICEEYNSRITNASLYSVARGRHRERGPDAHRTYSETKSGWTFTWEQRRHLEIEAHYGILFTAADRVISVPGRLGLVKRDWPVTAWELFPLSFMIDRVINVKRFLKTSIALSSPNVRISENSFEVIRQNDVKLLRLAKAVAPAIPLAKITPSTSTWHRSDEFSMIRSKWVPGLGEVISTLRGSGLSDTLTKTFDTTAIILGRLS
jgi:hypothetical protein